MKYEESIANINVDGKQSVCLELKEDIRKFLELLQEYDLLTYDFESKVEKEKIASLLFSCIMVVDGQCCEGDYIVTTDEDEEHDYEAFKETLLSHGWDDVTEERLKKVWELIVPFTTKRYVTWG